MATFVLLYFVTAFTRFTFHKIITASTLYCTLANRRYEPRGYLRVSVETVKKVLSNSQLTCENVCNLCLAVKVQVWIFLFDASN